SRTLSSRTPPWAPRRRSWTVGTEPSGVLAHMTTIDGRRTLVHDEATSMRLRSKILLALISILLAGDLLAVWIVQDRLQIGAEREAANQARARALQVQAVYAEHAATLRAEGEAISLYPAV